jgi:DNA-directed RNA polymerase specialized sigma24 family protein
MEHSLEDSVEAARAGNRAALEAVITGIQDRLYGIAMRMLAHPQDAQDADHPRIGYWWRSRKGVTRPHPVVWRK